MNLTWIEQALAAGGELTIKAPIVGNRIITTHMDWPGETPICGGSSIGLENALERLNEKLQEEAADEMVKAGVV